jgi:iron-regulated transporter 1
VYFTHPSQIPVVLVLWSLSSALPAEIFSRQNDESSVPAPQILIPIIFFAFLSTSRIGHYMNSLMVQELGQVEIPVCQRSTYAGTEQSFRSLGELGHWAATMVWSHPSQFKWLALGSLLLVGSSLVIFATWTRKSSRKSGRVYESVPMDDLEDDTTL